MGRVKQFYQELHREFLESNVSEIQTHITDYLEHVKDLKIKIPNTGGYLEGYEDALKLFDALMSSYFPPSQYSLPL